MHIDNIIWLRNVVDKLALKHHVETYEVEEALLENLNFFLLKKENEKGKMYIWLWGKLILDGIYLYYSIKRQKKH